MAVSAKELPPDSSHEGDAWLSGVVCRVRTTLPYEIVCVQMPNSFGVRARTRDLFAKRWGTYGMPSMKTYLTTFKRGDIVDIVANPAIHKGFPFKHYQGKTGVIWNVTKTSVGVIMNKKVGNRIIKKRLHLRIEHVKHSKSRMGFLKRVTENEEKRKQAKATGTKIPLKRSPVQPIGGHIIKAKQRPSELLRPVKFEFIA